MDEAVRETPIVRDAITASSGQAYLHRSRTPLGHVDISAATHYDDLMQQEWEGICGI